MRWARGLAFDNSWGHCLDTAGMNSVSQGPTCWLLQFLPHGRAVTISKVSSCPHGARSGRGSHKTTHDAGSREGAGFSFSYWSNPRLRRWCCPAWRRGGVINALLLLLPPIAVCCGPGAACVSGSPSPFQNSLLWCLGFEELLVFF